MCGRYSLTASAEQIVEHFQLLRPVKFQASYNIAPGQKILNLTSSLNQNTYYQ
jgi:putative SOS response-associated peptidase YedK